MSTVNWKESLDLLIKAIPPPAEPKHAGKITGLDSKVPKLPDDFCALVEAYGSGEFANQKRNIIELNNPLDPWTVECAKENHDILRNYRENEGAPEYPIFPEIPGLLSWGWSDQREDYFWKTEGTPNSWTCAYFADMQDLYEFEMPAVVFLQRLLFGEIHRKDLGYGDPDYDPTTIRFKPSTRK